MSDFYIKDPLKDYVTARCPRCDWSVGAASVKDLLEKGFVHFTCDRDRDYDEKQKRMVHAMCLQEFDIAISNEQKEKLLKRIKKYNQYQKLYQELKELES